MKKLAIFLFIVSLNLPFVVTKMVLQWQKKLVRREVKSMINAGLKDHELVKLTFAKKDINTLLKWEKIDEFDYLNQMYDIVRSTETKDSITYMCWKDDSESAIKKKLNELSVLEWHKNPNNKQQNERKSDFYKTLICPTPLNLAQNKQHFIEFHHTTIPYSIALYLSNIDLPIAPPPESKLDCLHTPDKIFGC